MLAFIIKILYTKVVKELNKTMISLKDKVVLITGGSRGIGLAMADAFAKEGASLAINYFGTEAEAKEAQVLIKKHKVECKMYHFDVSDFTASKEGVDKILKDFGKVDILVNNAGITRDKLVASMTEADFDAVVDTNLKGSFNMIKHLYSNYIRNRSGSIINIASVIGLMGGAGQANYSAAKAGLIGLTKTVARELGGRGITSNAIAPGFIESAMTAVLSEDTIKKYVELIPLKRTGKPEEVAAVAVFLAKSPYITGEVIKVDGGLYI